MTTEAEAAKAIETGRSPLWTLVVERGFQLLTALLTLITAWLGVVAVSATNQRDDLEDSVSSLEDNTEVLREDNQALRAQVTDLTESRDYWKERAETPASSAPADQVAPSSPPEQTCDSSLPEIWITPEATPIERDFHLTVSGNCFEPGTRLRIAISEDPDDCGQYECTDLGDVAVDETGGFANVEIDVVAAGVSELNYRGTVYVIVYSDDDQVASQPLRLT